MQLDSNQPGEPSVWFVADGSPARLVSTDEEATRVSHTSSHNPILQTLYHRYLDDEDAATFVKAVSLRYCVGTLERLAEYGTRLSRRAAIMALGFLGSYDSNDVLGRALHDDDRGVRMLAENGVRDLWCRDGSDSQRQKLGVVIRLNASQQFDEAVDCATELIDEAPFFAEAWNQRAVAHYYLQNYEDSANDCQQTLELNPYHFGAAVGMAHCYLELGDGFAALECFRRALKLNPDMEGVRAQVQYLERSLEEK